MQNLFWLLALATLMACNGGTPNKKPSSGAPAAWQLGPFAKADDANPVLQPDSSQRFRCPVQATTVPWEAKNVFNPAAVLRGDTVFLLYRAQDGGSAAGGTSRIGLAWSTDGRRFTRHPTPVLFPDNDAWKSLEWPGGCEDPRLVQTPDGGYLMTYTAYDGTTARLMVATSPDLFHWTKQGPAFSGRYRDFWSKSGSIVSRYDSGTPVAEKINGKYWMFWGDQNAWLASSTDLQQWTPVMDSAAAASPDSMLRRGLAAKVPELKPVFGPRAGAFDSDLVEPGPPAMLTQQGILLVYNSRNVQSIGDRRLPEGAYCPAQVLLDATNPGRVLQRDSTYFLKPDKPYEVQGQVAQVCFAEGLVRLRNRWLLYYGTADSKIAVAGSRE